MSYYRFILIPLLRWYLTGFSTVKQLFFLIIILYTQDINTFAFLKKIFIHTFKCPSHVPIYTILHPRRPATVQERPHFPIPWLIFSIKLKHFLHISLITWKTRHILKIVLAIFLFLLTVLSSACFSIVSFLLLIVIHFIFQILPSYIMHWQVSSLGC